MNSPLPGFLRFLRQHPWRWLLPLLTFGLLLVWLAWQAADVPSVPFVYGVF